MSQPYRISTLIVRANNHSDCAHSCRYCPINRKQSRIELARYARFVKRMQDWLADRPGAPKLYHALGYNSNYDEADLETLKDLDNGAGMRGITLGGLPERNEDELRTWLALLMRYGLQTVHATFGGAGEHHDRWNNKRGNYELLLRTLRASRELGLRLGQRMLVGKSTLGDLEPLLDVLEELPDRDGDWRYAMPFFYQTAAQRSQPEVEDDRIDEADRDALPPRILRLYTGKDSNRSEREWIERLAIREPAVVDVTMVIRLAAGSIDTLEQTPIADTYADMERRTGEAYAALPAFHELLERYGDRTNTKIYSLPRCLEMKWLDAYRRENPDHAFEQDLTHCWFGG